MAVQTGRAGQASGLGGMPQMLANVDQAISDAAAALLHAEQEREAARSALRSADSDVDEARQALDRLRRLRASLAGEDT